MGDVRKQTGGVESLTKSQSQPSSSTAGFFQERPKIENQFFEDSALRRVLKLYLPPSIQRAIAPDLSRFGEDVLSRQILDFVADAEKNPPHLKTWDTFGKRKDELVTSEGWRRLQAIGIEEGMIAIAYDNKEGPFSRVHQFLKYHIWTGSCAYVTCPSAMTDGAASLLSRHISNPSLSPSLRPVLHSAYQHLTSRDSSQAWTSGQWMTERSGGSDVAGTETIAIHNDIYTESKSTDGSPLGPYTIQGFKWFSSATDAQISVLLARTSSGNLSAFYAPMRRTIPRSTETELNGITIQRLKSKLGTRALPTAELVLSDMRGYMIGAEGDGVREISTILNITRVHNAVTAMGLWGRGLAISRAFSRVRKVDRGRRKLMDIPAHVATLADLEVKYRAHMHLTFFTVLLLGITENQKGESSPNSSVDLNSHFGTMPPSLRRITPGSTKEARTLLRMITPVTKALTAKSSIRALQECTESLGGIGYLENEEQEFNIARLFRDAAVLSIWEGTTEVMAGDLLRVIKGKQGIEALDTCTRWIDRATLDISAKGIGQLKEEWAVWRKRVEEATLESLQVYGREIVTELGRLIAGALLAVGAESEREGGGKGSGIETEVARRWMRDGRGTGGREMEKDAWKERVVWDRRIVFGDGGVDADAKL